MWVWISVDRIDKKFINFVIGDVSNKTGKKLYNSTNTMIIDTISTDHFRAYQGLIHQKKHLICKKYTILTVKFAIFLLLYIVICQWRKYIFFLIYTQIRKNIYFKCQGLSLNLYTITIFWVIVYNFTLTNKMKKLTIN